MILASAIKSHILETNEEVILCGSRHDDIFKQLKYLGFEPKEGYIEEFNNQKRILEEESHRAIRRKISDFSDDSNNDEIAGFVKGVISLETLLFNDLEKAGNR